MCVCVCVGLFRTQLVDLRNECVIGSHTGHLSILRGKFSSVERSLQISQPIFFILL